MVAPDLKPSLAELRQLPVEADIEAPEIAEWVCAADEKGAKYYACYHNRSDENDTPILITFDADVGSVIVDGRDFLFTLFQGGDPERARPVAQRLFGDAILHYLDCAWSTDDQLQRVAWCKLAVQDDGVVMSHTANRSVIGGRHNTRFCSAFMVRTPIEPTQVVEARQFDDNFEIPAVEISLDIIR